MRENCSWQVMNAMDWGVAQVRLEFSKLAGASIVNHVIDLLNIFRNALKLGGPD
jgi:hypothetical protein